MPRDEPDPVSGDGLPAGVELRDVIAHEGREGEVVDGTGLVNGRVHLDDCLHLLRRQEQPELLRLQLRNSNVGVCVCVGGGKSKKRSGLAHVEMGNEMGLKGRGGRKFKGE